MLTQADDRCLFDIFRWFCLASFQQCKQQRSSSRKRVASCWFLSLLVVGRSRCQESPGCEHRLHLGWLADGRARANRFGEQESSYTIPQLSPATKKVLENWMANSHSNRDALDLACPVFLTKTTIRSEPVDCFLLVSTQGSLGKSSSIENETGKSRTQRTYSKDVLDITNLVHTR